MFCLMLDILGGFELAQLFVCVNSGNSVSIFWKVSNFNKGDLCICIWLIVKLRTMLYI